MHTRTLQPPAVPYAVPKTSTAPVHSTKEAKSGSRLAFVDALRGMAAVLVVLHHVDRYRPHGGSPDSIVHPINEMTVHYGWIGVPVFFVISGFVISYSLRNVNISLSVIGNFLMRRGLRLNPGYWVTIAVMLAVIGICSWCGFQSPMESPVTIGQLVAHLFYVQNILGYENLSAGFWTLCIEMQFYILFVAMLWGAQGIERRLKVNDSGLRQTVWGAVFLPLGLWSLFVLNVNTPGEESRPYEHWCIDFFWMFLLGILVHAVLERRLNQAILWAFLAAIAIRLTIFYSLHSLVAFLTGVAILCVGRFGRLETALNYPPLQYLGRISYSLYLIHYAVNHLVVEVGFRIYDRHPAAEMLWLAFSIVLSFGAAHLLHVWVEVPSMQWSAQLKSRPVANVAYRVGKPR